ncbi:MAG: hypothetical protein J6D03_05845 [Clostridia bacterium]|nr:hypothetical protein [Clostridia bacterium]
MTNINCSSDCIYQKDGKCSYENIVTKKATPSFDCTYYLSKSAFGKEISDK